MKVSQSFQSPLRPSSFDLDNSPSQCRPFLSLREPPIMALTPPTSLTGLQPLPSMTQRAGLEPHPFSE